MALAREIRVLAAAVGATIATALIFGCATHGTQAVATKEVAVPQPATRTAPPPSQSTSSPTQIAAIPSATLIIHGMGCPLCANNVDKQLLKVPGVERVNIDLGSGRVKVSFAPGTERPGDAKLAKAVANSGYTLVRIQTP